MLAAAAVLAGADFARGAPAQPAECGTWQQCRQLALDAAADGAFERFHDLAWRAVQKGPANDPQLMYLLARAMSLSGRPHDALVMLRRLAEMGVATDAASNDDFERVRRLKEWPDVAARIAEAAPERRAEALRHDSGTAPRDDGAPASRDDSAPASRDDSAPASRDDSAPASRDDSAPASRDDSVPASRDDSVPGSRDDSAAGSRDENAAARPERGTPNDGLAPAREVAAPVEALRVPALAIRPVDLAYDRDSARYVVADARGRRLIILDERLRRSMDLVREQSAGFYDITALEIDRRGGDLWVVSADAAGATALHHVQLVSGRPLATLHPPAGLLPARFVDVAVGSGVVYVLDAAGGRVFRLAPRSKALEVAVELGVAEPHRLAVSPTHVLYVAHPDGIVRADPRTGRVQPLRTAAGVTLPQLTRLWWRHGTLVGLEETGDAAGVVRITLDASGSRAVKVVSTRAALPVNAAASLVGSDICFVSTSSDPAGTTIIARVPLP